MALITTLVLCARSQDSLLSVSMRRVLVVISTLLDLRAKESRVLRQVKPPRYGEASRKPRALSWDRILALIVIYCLFVCLIEFIGVSAARAIYARTLLLHFHFNHISRPVKITNSVTAVTVRGLVSSALRSQFTPRSFAQRHK